jgi:hypothetical protein
VRGVRLHRPHALVALLGIAAGSAACALVSGLSDFSEETADDASASTTASDGARAEPNGRTEDVSNDVSDDASDAGANDGAPAADAPSYDADADVQGDGRQVADVSDGGRAGDGGGDGGDGGCVLYSHTNGLGQTFVDCVPLDTYDKTEAEKACAAAEGGACAAASFCPGGDSLECMTGGNGPNTTCACWSYSGSTEGAVGTANGFWCTGPMTMECPTMGGTKWH